MKGLSSNAGLDDEDSEMPMSFLLLLLSIVKTGSFSSLCYQKPWCRCLADDSTSATSKVSTSPKSPKSMILKDQDRSIKVGNLHMLAATGQHSKAICSTEELILNLQKEGQNKNSHQVAALILDALRSFNGPQSSTSAFDVLIIALCKVGLLDDAYWVFHQIKHSPAVHACNALLNGLLKDGKPSCVRKLFDVMIEQGLEPSLVTYNTLINACRCLGDVSGALQLMNQVISSAAMKPTVVTYTTVICCLCEDGRILEALEQFEKMKKSGVSPNLYTYNAMISGYLGLLELNNAIVLYREMPSVGLLPNVVTFGILVDGLCKSGNLREARETFAGMVKYGVLPNVQVYNSLLDGYFKVGNVKMASRFYQEMLKAGIRSDTFTYSIFINGLSDSGRVQEGVDMLQKMQHDGVVVNNVVYNTLIDGYCKEGRVEDALNLCSKMSKEGIQPNFITFTSLIDGQQV